MAWTSRQKALSARVTSSNNQTHSIMRLNIAVIAAATVMASALVASATLVSYSLDGSGPMSYAAPTAPPAGAPHGPVALGGDGWGYPGDTVTLQAGSGAGYSFNLLNGATYNNMPIGTLAWGVDYTYGGSATDYTAWSDLLFAVNAVRNIHIGAATASISQVGLLKSTWDDDYLSLSAGPMASVLVQDGAQWYRVDITPNSLPIAGVNSFNGNVDPPAGGFDQTPRAMTATFQVTAVEVPEPTTMIAGALLLLPFGASTLRILRKSRKA